MVGSLAFHIVVGGAAYPNIVTFYRHNLLVMELAGYSMATIFDRLHGSVTGSGERTLLLLHGFGTDQRAWEALRPWLSGFFTVLSYNIAGAGADGAETCLPQRHHHLYGHVDDFLEILAGIKQSAVTVLAHSTGVMIGLTAAAIRPDKVGRVLALQGLPRYLAAEDYPTKLAQTDLNEMYATIHKNHAAWANGFARKTLAIEEPLVLDVVLRHLLSMSPEMTIALMRAFFQADVRECQPRIRVPVHILHGKQDPLTPLAAVRAMKRQIAHATLDSIPVTGHLPHVTQPELLKPVLAGYLDIPFHEAAP